MGKTLASGIEKGEKATETVKETMGVFSSRPNFIHTISYLLGMKTEQAKQSAQEAKDQADHKANRVCPRGF